MQTLTAREIAAAAGVAPQSARDLVRKLGLTAIGRDMETGAKLYDVDQVQAALATRPGRGSRTDLGKRVTPLTDAERRRVAGWATASATARERAAQAEDPQVGEVLVVVATQLDRLVAAAARYPLYALHPNADNPHRRLYDLVAKTAHRAWPLVRDTARHYRPLLWMNAAVLIERLVRLTDLAVAGQPIPADHAFRTSGDRAKEPYGEVRAGSVAEGA